MQYNINLEFFKIGRLYYIHSPVSYGNLTQNSKHPPCLIKSHYCAAAPSYIPYSLKISGHYIFANFTRKFTVVKI